MADKENKSEIVTENPTEEREKKKAKKPKFFSRITGFFKIIHMAVFQSFYASLSWRRL